MLHINDEDDATAAPLVEMVVDSHLRPVPSPPISAEESFLADYTSVVGVAEQTVSSIRRAASGPNNTIQSVSL